MPRIAAVLVLALAASAQQTMVRIVTVDRPTIEARLRLDPTKNDLREAAVKAMFVDVGCADTREQRVSGTRIPNVICTLPGSSPRTILVTAHTDKVSEGTGILDNWSGASLLASFYQSLAGLPRRHTFIFVGTSDEEQGLYGARAYVEAMKKPDRQAVRAVVNIDTLAAGTTRIWPEHSVPELANDLARVAASMKLPISGWSPGARYDDDSTPFAADRLPTLMVHSLDASTIGFLHNKNDSPDHVQWDAYYDSYRLLATFLAYLDTLDDPTPQQ